MQHKQTPKNPQRRTDEAPQLILRPLGSPDRSLRFFRKLEQSLRCNVVVFNSLIDACVRACDLQGAAEVRRRLCTSTLL